MGWPSPEWLLVAQRCGFDPRRGETDYGLGDSERSEPGPAAVKVVADCATSASAAGRD